MTESSVPDPKARLHQELTDLLRAEQEGSSKTARTRLGSISMVGHALIELELLTEIECGWVDCKFSTRKFSKDPSKRTDPMQASLDHVVPLFLGGTDLPDNLMLLHLGCNGSKGAREYFALPESRKRHAEISKKRWEDPDYAERTKRAAADGGRRPEVAARKSEAMKRHWEDPDNRIRRVAVIQESWDRLSPEEKSARAAGSTMALQRRYKTPTQ